VTDEQDESRRRGHREGNGDAAYTAKVLGVDVAEFDGTYPAPFGKWTSGGLEEFYRGRNEVFDGEEREPAGRARIRARLRSERALMEILGAPVYKDTTILIAKHGEWIGECVVDRAKQTWSLWAPHRRLAVDIFPKDKDVPALHILEAKKNFADEHKFKYVIVPPGHGFSFDDVNELIGEEHNG